MKVAIIGCGPAGLLAAHAVVLAGSEPVIYSKTAEPSPHARATYLHRSIPDLTSPDPDGVIEFVKFGPPEGYASRVYGSPFAPTSWARFAEGPQPGWALATAYAELWARYRGDVIEAEIGSEEARSLSHSFPMIINTAPLRSFCDKIEEHLFPSRDIWVREGCAAMVERNSIVYSGSARTRWYRSSDIFGTCATEYDHHVLASSHGIKVQPTNCNCHQYMIRAGRWGTWKPGVLVHHAFETAEAALGWFK